MAGPRDWVLRLTSRITQVQNVLTALPDRNSVRRPGPQYQYASSIGRST